MFLKKLYSEPAGLFRSGKESDPYTIVFKEGFNFIFGKKDNIKEETKQPLNGIGKSTLVDLIDFCLLADFNSKNKRLYKEAARLEGHKIVLEFDSQGKSYVIKRDAADKKNVFLGPLGDEREVSIKEAKNELFQIFFNNPDYEGVIDERWYRSLLSFFLKIHKKKKGEFVDPINFLTDNNRISEINQYQFFLLGIDTRLICLNNELQKNARNRNTAISQVKRIVEQNYGITIKNVDSQISKLRNEVKKSKKLIEAFKLAQQHEDVEARMNSLTAKIKFLSEQNFWKEKRIESYKESISIKDLLSDSKIANIKKLYNEVNDKLASIIDKSIQDAVAFRIQLAESREGFLREEIRTLENEVKANNEEKVILDDERRKMFLSLQSKEAFASLTQAYYYLGELERELSDLEAKVKTYRDLENEKQLFKKEDAEISLAIQGFLDSIQTKIDDFEKVFSEVYNRLYPESVSSGFSITPNYKSDKVSILVTFDKEESKGWNKGRTLVYDIAIMQYGIEHGINFPRFLIHDGIFDGMDKSQFVELYHYIQYLQSIGIRFQYIVTMIEEGTLNEQFGDADELTPERIAEEAIAVFTPSKKFWV